MLEVLKRMNRIVLIWKVSLMGVRFLEENLFKRCNLFLKLLRG